MVGACFHFSGEAAGRDHARGERRDKTRGESAGRNPARGQRGDANRGAAVRGAPVHSTALAPGVWSRRWAAGAGLGPRRLPAGAALGLGGGAVHQARTRPSDSPLAPWGQGAAATGPRVGPRPQTLAMRAAGAAEALRVAQQGRTAPRGLRGPSAVLAPGLASEEFYDPKRELCYDPREKLCSSGHRALRSRGEHRCLKTKRSILAI